MKPMLVSLASCVLALFALGGCVLNIERTGPLDHDRQSIELDKSEMVRAGVKNAELAKRLTDMGLPETEASVQVKINRGVFPAWFMLATMRAVGAHTLRLE